MTSSNNLRSNQVITNSIKLNIFYRPEMVLLILKIIFVTCTPSSERPV